MGNTFQKVILLPCLCCISFYTGNQIVGDTEASFSSQVSPNSIEISTAFVFPSTIKQLEDRALKIANTINKNYETITATSLDASVRELNNRLAKITENKQELNLELNTLQSIYDELSAYQKRIQDQKETNNQTFDYVNEGFQKVSRISKEVHALVDFQYIEAVRSSITLQINKLEKEQASKVDTQTNHSQENSEYLDLEASMNSINKEQMTQHEEETIEDSK